MLEKELKQFSVQKDDLRFTLYSMIMVMLQDNIEMRLWVNDLMQNQIDDSKKKLESHSKHQSDIATKKRQDTESGQRHGTIISDMHREYPTSKRNNNSHEGAGGGHIKTGRPTPNGSGVNYKDSANRRDKSRQIQEESKGGAQSNASNLMGSTKLRKPNETPQGTKNSRDVQDLRKDRKLKKFKTDDIDVSDADSQSSESSYEQQETQKSKGDKRMINSSQKQRSY